MFIILRDSLDKNTEKIRTSKLARWHLWRVERCYVLWEPVLKLSSKWRAFILRCTMLVYVMGFWLCAYWAKFGVSIIAGRQTILQVVRTTDSTFKYCRMKLQFHDSVGSSLQGQDIAANSKDPSAEEIYARLPNVTPIGELVTRDTSNSTLHHYAIKRSKQSWKNRSWYSGNQLLMLKTVPWLTTSPGTQQNMIKCSQSSTNP